MKVQIGYKNKDLEIIGYDVFDFDLYLNKLSQDAIGVLSDVEKCLSANDIDCNADEGFRLIRNRLLNLAGSLKRLPENTIAEGNYSKATKEKLLSAIRGV